MVATHVRRSKGNSSGFVTHRLKVFACCVDCPCRNVLGKNVPGSDICHDPPHFRPKVVRAIPAAGCCGICLAGKAARNDVNSAAPFVSVEGAYIVPNGERWQVPLILSLHASSGAKGVVFHGTDGLPAEQMRGKYSATSAREKCQLIQPSSPIKTANPSPQRTRYARRCPSPLRRPAKLHTLALLCAAVGFAKSLAALTSSPCDVIAVRRKSFALTLFLRFRHINPLTHVHWLSQCEVAEREDECGPCHTCPEQFSATHSRVVEPVERFCRLAHSLCLMYV